MAGTRKKENEDFVQHCDGHAIIKLSRPLKIAAVPVEALKMREPTVRDQLIADASTGSDLEKEVAYFANLLEITPDQVKSLPVRDYRRLVHAYAGFTD